MWMRQTDLGRKKRDKPKEYVCPICYQTVYHSQVVIHHIIPKTGYICGRFHEKISEDRNLAYICQTCNLGLNPLTSIVTSEAREKWEDFYYGPKGCTKIPYYTEEEIDIFCEKLFQETLVLCKEAMNKLRIKKMANDYRIEELIAINIGEYEVFSQIEFLEEELKDLQLVEYNDW
jgi:hypothetical protein